MCTDPIPTFINLTDIGFIFPITDPIIGATIVACMYSYYTYIRISALLTSNVLQTSNLFS